jgi:hypothetical protein
MFTAPAWTTRGRPALTEVLSFASSRGPTCRRASRSSSPRAAASCSNRRLRAASKSTMPGRRWVGSALDEALVLEPADQLCHGLLAHVVQRQQQRPVPRPHLDKARGGKALGQQLVPAMGRLGQEQAEVVGRRRRPAVATARPQPSGEGRRIDSDTSMVDGYGNGATPAVRRSPGRSTEVGAERCSPASWAR